MSGGVDSSVAAALLVEQGYDVTGGFIKNWSDTKDLWTGECEWRGERRDALRVAARLNIPLLTFDFEKEYRERVLDRMFREYESGITPNPDVLCNEEIKFGLFFEAAMERGFDGIATGHYARVRHAENNPLVLPINSLAQGINSLVPPINSPKPPINSLVPSCTQEGGIPFNHIALPLSTRGAGGVMVPGEEVSAGSVPREDVSGMSHLLKAIDPEKDQSYFLHRVSQEALSKTLFPIGDFPKAEVRKLAAKFDLPTATKPDSQGICFVGKIDFHDFLRKKIPAQPGEIINPEGEVIGTHDGLDGYTIGQRQGIKVSKEGKAWYVAGKDQKTNRLIVVNDREHPMLYRSELSLRNIHWIAGVPSHPEVEIAVRYHAPPIAGSLAPSLAFSPSERERSSNIPSSQRRGGHSSGRGGGSDRRGGGSDCLGGGSTILLHEPAWAPAPGQSAVLYQGDECLGGGFLTEDGIDSAPIV